MITEEFKTSLVKKIKYSSLQQVDLDVENLLMKENLPRDLHQECVEFILSKTVRGDIRKSPSSKKLGNFVCRRAKLTRPDRISKDYY